jgi:hypothetical protein
MALIKDNTATLRPSFLDIILKGLSTLSILIALMKAKSTLVKNNEIIYKDYWEILTATATMTKSMMFHEFLIYENLPLKINPNTITLIMHSRAKTVVKKMSI